MSGSGKMTTLQAFRSTDFEPPAGRRHRSSGPASNRGPRGKHCVPEDSDRLPAVTIAPLLEHEIIKTI